MWIADLYAPTSACCWACGSSASTSLPANLLAGADGYPAQRRSWVGGRHADRPPGKCHHCFRCFRRAFSSSYRMSLDDSSKERRADVEAALQLSRMPYRVASSTSATSLVGGENGLIGRKPRAVLSSSPLHRIAQAKSPRCLCRSGSASPEQHGLIVAHRDCMHTIWGEWSPRSLPSS